MSGKIVKPFLQGAFILVLANFIVKFIGVIYKIPLTNLIGGYGMGFFNAAFEIHQLLLALSTAGLPVAVSKMISESHALDRYREVKKIFRVVLYTFIGVGLIGACVMFFGAEAFSRLINTDLAKYSIMALAPAMFFYAVTAIFRGYFQGLQNMYPTAFTQVLEAICKLAVGISLAYILISRGFGAEYVSAGAIFGTTASTILASTLLIFIYLRPSNRKRFTQAQLSQGRCRTSRRILKDLIRIVIPVTAGSLVVNLTGFLDLFLIMNRLGDIGLSQMEATTIYGAYKSCAQTLFNLPPSIIASINVSVIPAVASAFVLRDIKRLKKIINTALKVVSLFAVPCAIGLFALADPILHLLFPFRPDEVQIATPLLRIMGIASLWVSIASLTTASLQAMGRVNIPVISLAIGGAIKLVTNYFLVGNPDFGIIGAPIGTNLCYLVIMTINLKFLFSNTGIRPRIKNIVVKPLISGAVMGIFSFFIVDLLARFLPSSLSTAITIIASALLYLLVLIFLGGIRKSDISMIPKGEKIAALLRLK